MRYSITILLLTFFYISAFSQANLKSSDSGEISALSTGPGGDPGGDVDSNVPIDGGASWLAVAGIVYGIKKYRDNRKKNEKQDSPILQ